MSDAVDMSSVAYKKGNWMRYTLWGVALLAVVVLIFTFIKAISDTSSKSVPSGYRFSVTDNYNNDSKQTIYYIYDDRILVEDDDFSDDKIEKKVMIYDGLNTSSLILIGDETEEVCTSGFCRERPKVLKKIKSMISGKVGREYIGF